MLLAAAMAVALAVAAPPPAALAGAPGPGADHADGAPAVGMDGSLASFTSGLPVVLVDTQGKPLSADRPCSAVVAAWLPGSDGRTRLASPPALVAAAEVRLRGASSLLYPKKQSVLRFTGTSGEDAPVPFLGMPAGARFVLRPSYVDKTLLRDALASSLARDMGMAAPRARHVEVILASSGDRPNRAHYHGVYVAMENVEVGPGRVEIDPLGPAAVREHAISGGYLLLRDRPGRGDTVVRTRRGEALILLDPPPDRVRPEQVAWITGYLDRLETALFSDDPRERRSALALVDVPSFVNLALLVEATRNADGLKTSTFFSKPRGGPLRAGPPWDHDASMRNDPVAVDPTGWEVLRQREGRSPWWPRLAEDPDVAQALADRWAELRSAPLSDAAVVAKVRALTEGVAEAAARNFERWPILGKRVGTNPDAPATWLEEVANLEAWLRLRLAWLDAQWPAPPRIATGDGGGRAALVEDGEPFAAQSDPRAPGGGVAEGAMRLEGTPPRRTVLLERAGRRARCGSEDRIALSIPEGTDELAVETAAPPRTGFVLGLAGIIKVTRPPLPIARSLQERASAMRRDGLHHEFRAAVPAGRATLSVTAIGGPACEVPKLRVVALRAGRYALPADVDVLVVRSRRGEKWTAPLRIDSRSP